MSQVTTTLRVFRLHGGITGTPEIVEPSRFSAIGALEVQHIEQWLNTTPALLGEELKIVSRQFAGFDRTRDRLDLLALDPAGKLVVIEIKRDDSGSAQDLQALRYAAYVSTLQRGDVVTLFQKYAEGELGRTLEEEEARHELETFATLDDLDEDERPRIILVSRTFQVGVTNTVLSLSRSFGLDITCVQLTPFEVDGEVLVTSTTLIPLPEAADDEVRLQEKRRRASEQREVATINFEEALRFISSVPAGRWTTYGDIARAAGSLRGAQAIGTWLLRTEGIPNVWRVLRGGGDVSVHWKGVSDDVPATPADVKEWLQREGVKFDDQDRAAPDQRWTLDDLRSQSAHQMPVAT